MSFQFWWQYWHFSSGGCHSDIDDRDRHCISEIYLLSNTDILVLAIVIDLLILIFIDCAIPTAILRNVIDFEMLMNILCSVLLCVHRNNIYMLSWSAQIVTRSVFEARACGNDLFPYTCVITNTGCCEHRLTHHQPKYKTEIEARACGNVSVYMCSRRNGWWVMLFGWLNCFCHKNWKLIHMLLSKWILKSSQPDWVTSGEKIKIIVQRQLFISKWVTCPQFREIWSAMGQLP